MRRALIILAALVLLTPFAPANASAYWPKTKCLQVGEQAQLCLDVYAYARSGGGWHISHVYERLQGGFWESHAFTCSYVGVWSATGNRWKRVAPACDLYRSPGYTLFSPDVNVGTSTAEIALAGWPYLNQEVDPGWTKVRVNLP